MNRPARPLSPSEVDAYQHDGHVVLEGLFAADEVSSWVQECERLWATVRVERDNPRVQWRGLVDGGEIPDRIDPVLDISPVYDALSRDPRLIAAAGRLLDGTATPFKAKLITKRPGTLGYGMHQDYPYWELLGLPASDYVNALVAFDPFEGENGSTELFTGMHHVHLPAPTGSPLDTDESVLQGRPSVMLTLAAGDVVLFHSLTPHRSGPNRGTHSRRGLFLTYVPARYPNLNDRYERVRLDKRH